MKHKILLSALFVLLSNMLIAQSSETTTYTIKWKGTESWIADSSSIKVVAFEGAQYPTDDRLPYVNKRISIDPLYAYFADISNQIYTLASSEEASIIKTAGLISENIKFTSTILKQGTSSFLDVLVLPFILKDGQIHKLVSFDLAINKSAQKQKASSSTIHTYANKSVLAQGKFIKIKLINSGVYKLTFEELNAMGITPANVRIFGYGGGMLEQSFLLPKNDDLPETAIWMEKGSDGIFNAGDYILFYAQGINRWAYDTSYKMFSHVSNPYSKYAYYFVTSDAGIGKKIESSQTTVPSNATISDITEFTDYQLYEKDLRSIISSGKEFYGEVFRDITAYSFPFNFPNPVLTSQVITKLDVAASSTENSSFSLNINGTQSKSITVYKLSTSDSYEIGKSALSYNTFTPQSESFNLNLVYNRPNSTAAGYLNYLEVNARRYLTMSGSVMQFQNVDNLGKGTYNRYFISNASSSVVIWDITDPININKVETEIVNGKLSFIASGDIIKNYIAIDTKASTAFSKPTTDGTVTNQNLHGLSSANMVIITHPNFITQSNKLAQVHREKDNLTVEVVTTEQVYNEFSSGAPDATAYRWMMKMMYDRAIAANNTSNMPKYLLLFGKGSFDNRGILSDSGNNLILTYQTENSLSITSSYVTDDYFALLDDNEGTAVSSNLIDLGVGRFPVITAQEATDVVNKTINYINNTGKGNWKNQLCYLADDGDAALHMKQSDSIASMVGRLNPSYQVNKIFLDAYQQEVTASGESYPLAKTRFQNLLRTGLFLLNFTGHASAAGWTNESILTTADVKSLSNVHLPIFIGATCDFLQFDGSTVTAGEHVVLNPNGGGIGILSAARPVYASQNMTLNKYFCEYLFKKVNGENIRVGDALKLAKNSTGSEINKLSYIYMGDPALKLAYPNKYKVITSKVNESTSFGADTLKALSIATVQGYIADENGTKIENFNGSIHSVVYDKVQQIITLNNHNEGAFTYNDRPNTVFSGESIVKDGTFTFTFMLPKDIKYNYGAGRINYYAQDDTNDYEAQGYFENFLIGGTNSNYTSETNGPEVEMFLNSSNFKSGDKVNETPLFVANIKDMNGINTVGSGIGHDIMLIIDNSPSNSVVMNDYFQASANSYSEGVLKYKLSELSEGKHTLTFRVWDLLNNSTNKTIDFEVVKGLTPVIFSVYNYPNPVRTKTSIKVVHDRPETILSCSLEIFDLSGRKIYYSTQSSIENINWDSKGADGLKVKPGIYLYRVNIKTKDSDICSKTNKMLIVE